MRGDISSAGSPKRVKVREIATNDRIRHDVENWLDCIFGVYGSIAYKVIPWTAEELIANELSSEQRSF